MKNAGKGKTILVFGATGQQGGSVASALLENGWTVRALVRDPDKEASQSLKARGVEIVRGDLSDPESIKKAMHGVYGVFSMQTSSGQGAVYGTSDEDEVRQGKSVASIASAVGVEHFVYTSSNGSGGAKTGIPHFDTKTEIEQFIKTLPLPWTIVRPVTFMELLTLPGMGLNRGMFTFFMRDDQPLQFIAVRDIGRIVAQVFAHPQKYEKRAFEIAGDSVTGRALGEAFSRAAGKPILYSRFPDALLRENAFLGNIATLMDSMPTGGKADLPQLREEFPTLTSLDEWLKTDGHLALQTALTNVSEGVALR